MSFLQIVVSESVFTSQHVACINYSQPSNKKISIETKEPRDDDRSRSFMK